MAKAHLATLPQGLERSLVIQATTQLVHTVKDPELRTSLAKILSEAAQQHVP
jgi:hypothetical protein